MELCRQLCSCRNPAFSGILSLIMPEGEASSCPETETSEDILRGRTLDEVLEITDSADVVIKGITFWASNIMAANNNNRIMFDSLIFKFPSSSHRMLKSAAFPKHTKMYGNGHAVINCTFEGAEGPALQRGPKEYCTNNMQK